MINNPFLSHAVLNTPLKQEFCQQLHFEAVRHATHGLLQEVAPDSIRHPEFHRRSTLLGNEAYLFHPLDIDSIFNGITLSVYQAIENLYCCRVARSIPMVSRIINAMARHAQLAPITYEAVWAICLYLHDQYVKHVDVTYDYVDVAWRLIMLEPDVIVVGDADTAFRPSIICVLAEQPERVIAFRIVNPSQRLEDAVQLALYDAIVSQRRPSFRAAAGVRWLLPHTFLVDMPLPSTCISFMQQLDIHIQGPDGVWQLIEAISGDWTRDLTERRLPQRYFAELVDTYLHNVHGYGPIRLQRRHDRTFRYRIGYNRDPSWQFPDLRAVLPESSSSIDLEGAVESNELHYDHPLLSYFIGQNVKIRVSEHAEALAWIYLDGEVMCQATARELRRRDGSFRPYRVRR